MRRRENEVDEGTYTWDVSLWRRYGLGLHRLPLWVRARVATRYIRCWTWRSSGYANGNSLVGRQSRGAHGVVLVLRRFQGDGIDINGFAEVGEEKERTRSWDQHKWVDRRFEIERSCREFRSQQCLIREEKGLEKRKNKRGILTEFTRGGSEGKMKIWVFWIAF